MIHRKATENLRLVKKPKLPGALPLEATKVAYSAGYEPPAARANVLTYVGLCSMAIKLNPS